jgi:hypothetical protein
MVDHPWLITLPLSLLTALSLIIAGFAYFGQAGVSDRVTTIEQSPCVKDPSSKECNEIRQELLHAEPLGTACIQFRKVLPEEILAYTRCVLPEHRKFQPGG